MQLRIEEIVASKRRRTVILNAMGEVTQPWLGERVGYNCYFWIDWPIRHTQPVGKGEGSTMCNDFSRPFSYP